MHISGRRSHADPTPLSLRILVSRMARTFITLMAGAFVGILLSPISLWLLLHGDQISPVQVQKAYLSCARTSVTQQDVLASRTGRVTSRKLVYTAVLASQDGVRARAGSIHRTWGRQLGKHYGLYVFSKPGLPISTHMDGVPVNFVATNTSAPVPQNLQKLMLLQHLMDMTPSLLDYEFVLLTGDDLFVHAGNLHRLLQSVSPTNAFYLGRTASSNHCLGGPGILLSQAALSGLKKKIGDCVKSLSNQIFPIDIDGDEILGKCMKSSLGLHCTELDKVGYSNSVQIVICQLLVVNKDVYCIILAVNNLVINFFTYCRSTVTNSISMLVVSLVVVSCRDCEMW